VQGAGGGVERAGIDDREEGPQLIRLHEATLIVMQEH
jgi:hypothetical protein